MTNFRHAILSQLQERDQQCQKFARIFRAHNDLLESFNHVLSSKSAENQSDEECGTSEGKSLQSQLALVKTELSDIYKKKALNDQRLIETNEKISELERKIADGSMERDEYIKQAEETLAELQNIEQEVARLQQDNLTLNDECIASEFLMNGTKAKLKSAIDEQKELVIRVEQMKLLNAELARS